VRRARRPKPARREGCGEQDLQRRAEREPKRIRVDVRDGIATLTGSVHTWAERESVVAAARFTPGVRDVQDHLRTEPV
jgi:hyperosmotically inducible protein